MSSIAHRYSIIANHEHPDLAATPQPNYAGLNGAAVKKDIWPQSFAARLADLIAEHDDLDQAVASMLSSSGSDDLVISRLKKRKLHIKDEISQAQIYMRGLVGSVA
jgi:hypothetical protein